MLHILSVGGGASRQQQHLRIIILLFVLLFDEVIFIGLDIHMYVRF